MADMLIMDKNPLENIEDLNTLTSLVVKGEIVDKHKLDQLLKELQAE